MPIKVSIRKTGQLIEGDEVMVLLEVDSQS